MLIGEHRQKIQSNRRIALPKKFRDLFGDKVIISKGYEGCLLIMSPALWEELVTKPVSGPFVSELIRDTSRFLFASASEIELDHQGRFVIPLFLFDYVGFNSDGVFLGLGRWAELWSISKWIEKAKEIEKESTRIGDKLSQIV